MKAKELLALLELPLAIAQAPGKINSITSHIRIAGGKAAATDLAVSIEIDCPLDINCCVPADRIGDALANMPGDAEVGVKMTKGRVVITGPRSRHTMATLPAEDLPYPSWQKDIKPIADWSAHVSAIEYVRHAVATKDIRNFLLGAASQGGSWIGSDGHRAAVARGESEIKGDVIIPGTALQTVCKLKGVTGYSAEGEATLTLVFPGGRYCCSLINARYPDMTRYFPEKHSDDLITVNREAFTQTTKAVTGVQHADFLRVTISKDLIVLEDETHEGSARFEVACSYVGEEKKFGINGSYLARAVDAQTGKELTLSQAKTDAPLLISGGKESRQEVIMPSRV